MLLNTDRSPRQYPRVLVRSEGYRSLVGVDNDSIIHNLNEYVSNSHGNVEASCNINLVFLKGFNIAVFWMDTSVQEFAIISHCPHQDVLL